MVLACFVVVVTSSSQVMESSVTNDANTSADSFNTKPSLISSRLHSDTTYDSENTLSSQANVALLDDTGVTTNSDDPSKSEVITDKVF